MAPEYAAKIQVPPLLVLPGDAVAVLADINKHNRAPTSTITSEWRWSQ